MKDFPCTLYIVYTVDCIVLLLVLLLLFLCEHQAQVQPWSDYGQAANMTAVT